jgi:hypothetical protein
MTVLGIGFIIIKAALSNFREAGARTLYFSQGFLGGVILLYPNQSHLCHLRTIQLWVLFYCNNAV